MWPSWIGQQAPRHHRGRGRDVTRQVSEAVRKHHPKQWGSDPEDTTHQRKTVSKAVTQLYFPV